MPELFETILQVIAKDTETESTIEQLLANKEYLEKELAAVNEESKDTNLALGIKNFNYIRRDSLINNLKDVENRLSELEASKEKAA